MDLLAADEDVYKRQVKVLYSSLTSGALKPSAHCAYSVASSCACQVSSRLPAQLESLFSVSITLSPAST